MSQHPWEREYKSPKFISGDDTPQRSVLKFFRYLRKQNISLDHVTVLDIGCGLGRNSIYVAEQGAKAIGYDISHTAIREATRRARGAGVNATFQTRSIAEPFPLEDNSVDIVIDVTASNALTKEDRQVYLQEIKRVLKPNGYMFVRTLAKDGDENAKKMLKKHPGPEPDMYEMPKTGITERVFTRVDFLSEYKDFSLQEFKKTTSYTKIDNNSYKRNFFLAYFQLL